MKFLGPTELPAGDVADSELALDYVKTTGELKIVASTTAPADTSVLWIDLS